MNIAIFNSHTLLATHYEAELEIIFNHQEKGDHVVQLVCNKDLPACDTNPYFHPEACERCVSKRKNGYSSTPIKPSVVPFFLLTEADKKRIADTPKQYSSIHDLQQLYVDNYDVGYAVASSIISHFRDPNPPLDPKWVERYIIGCLGVYFSMINYLKANPTDLVYAFNGRLSHTKAVLQACRLMKVNCELHERGNSLPFYSLFSNTSIHDLKNTQQLILETWEKADPIEREATARRWFETRMGGKMENWYSFLEKQVFELPEGWDTTKNNVLICNSSEDEFASLGEEWKNPLYKNQTEGVFRIIRDALPLKNTHIYLRVHPHLAKVDNEELRSLLAFKSPNLTIIPASSLISTYNLVRHATRVITFGSTIGMETTYMGKPSILAGKSFYHNMGGTYDPANHEELMELVTKELEAKPQEIAMKFAYFFGTFGIRFQHYVPEDFDRGNFKGKYIKSDDGLKLKWIKAIYHNKKFPQLSEWLRLRLREKLTHRYLP